jgi:hypothetical protein
MHINRVVLTGNLTKDPEAKGQRQVCALRVAVNARRRNAQGGVWEDQPNYLDVTVVLRVSGVPEGRSGQRVARGWRHLLRSAIGGRGLQDLLIERPEVLGHRRACCLRVVAGDRLGDRAVPLG